MPLPRNRTKLALVDDHTLFRKGLRTLIDMVGNQYDIIFEADNGLQLQQLISKDNEPDIILMDVNMPKMDGFETVTWLTENFPLVRILIVSMVEQEETIVRMLKLGVKGYLCKDVEPRELGEALEAVMNKGYYYTDFITGKLVHSIQQDRDTDTPRPQAHLNARELSFLQLACSELTYQEIAGKMFLSPKTIDGYRDALFEKLNARSRVGLVLYAIRNGLVKL
jgi:two-component system, NarL family, invasion response regulator UvrY